MNTMNYTETKTIMVDSVPFVATLWWDHSDNTVDVEAYGLVPVTTTAMATPLEVEVQVYTICQDTWQDAFVSAARNALREV